MNTFLDTILQAQTLDDMWSSKWVLPEHREALISDDKGLKKIFKPALDEQEISAIDQAINDAIKRNGTIVLTVFSTYELKTITGTVLKLDIMRHMVKEFLRILMLKLKNMNG